MRLRELGTHDLLERLHRTLLALLGHRAAKARGRAAGRGTGVRGHDDDRVLKADHAALCVGQAAVVQDLQQGVEHVRVRLFDLVEQHNRVRAAADLFSQLAGLVIAT